MAKGRDPDEMTTAEIIQAFDRGNRLDTQPAGPANGKHAQAMPAMLSKEGFLRGHVPPDYLIDNVLQRRFIYAMTGQTGHAKTAIALRLAKLVSQRRRGYLAGHEVEHGRVLYLVGENPDDVRMRIMGEDGANSFEAAADDIYFIPGIFDVDKLFADLEKAVALVGDLALVIVDTSAAYFLGNEEMSNTQMGEHARKLRRLTTLAGGPCVVVLCHPVKHVLEPSQLLPRGGGAFLAEIDGNLTAWMSTEGVVEFHHGKIRGPGFEPITFRLEKVTTESLVDSKGRKLPTIRAVPVSTSDQERAEESEVAEENTLLVARLNGPAQMSMGDLATACGWFMANGDPYKMKVARMCAKLVVDRLMRKYRKGYVLTEAGKKAAREAEAAAVPVGVLLGGKSPPKKQEKLL